MNSEAVVAIKMPKWGLSMSEGTVGDWLVDEGAAVNVGDEILDVETDKIASSVEATQSGVLRRKVGQLDQIIPVGGLLGVMADPSVPDSVIDQFIDDFQENFVPEEDGEDEDGIDAYAKVAVGEFNIRYLQQGNGDEKIILIHGFGGDLDNWLFNLTALSSKATVYALDLPGHGQSSKQINDGSVSSLAQLVMDFMAAIDCGSAHLVGHSLGGLIAQQLAVDHPEKAKSLNLIASAGLGGEINQAYLDGFIGANSRRELKPWLQNLFADGSLVTRQMVDDILKFKRLDGTAQALQLICDACFVEGQQQTLLADRLTNPAIPVQIIWGREDQIIPVSHVDSVSDALTVSIIDNAGHMVHMESPAEINQILIDFIHR